MAPPASRRKARAWSAENPGNVANRDEVAARALALAAADLGGEVLDVGCGTGWWLARLAAEGVDPARLHGLDASTDRVAAAAARAPGATVVVGDAAALPYDDGRFGLCSLFLVLSSLPNAGAVRTALAEVRRVTRPGGAVLVWEPRVPTPSRATRRITPIDLRVAGRIEAGVPVTLLPPLARRLGRGAYARLAGVTALRTHRLYLLRPGADG